jgi:predicted nucleic acid-binding protein
VRLIADTGGIVAAMNTAEPDHERYRATLESAALAVITPLVITEVHYLLSSVGAQESAQDFLEDVAGGFYELAASAPEDYTQAGGLIKRYAGKIERKRRKPGSLDLADAMNIVIAGRYGTNLLLATDQDYRITQPLSGHHYFVLLPQDSADTGGAG